MPDLIENLAEKNDAQPSRFLAGKLAALRRREVAVGALTGTAMIVIVLVETMALVLFLDWWLELPWGVRLVLLLAQLAGFAWFGYRFIATPILHSPGEDELALMVEKARPIFRTRLIASIQLTRPDAIPSAASRALVDALVEDTESIAAPMDFNVIVPTDKLQKLAAVALVVAALGLSGFIAGGSTSTDLLKRALLFRAPVPRKTRIEVIDGDKVVGRGDSVRLEARVAGIIPANGKVQVEYSGHRSQDFTLEQDRANRRRFGRTIDNVQEGFTYTFYLNDGQSLRHEVRTIPRPAMLNLECNQTYPAYTRHKPERRTLGDLSLLAGSQISLKGSATKPLQAAALKFVGAPVNFPLPIMSGFPPLLMIRKTPMEIIPLTLGGQTEISGGFMVPSKGLAGFSVLLLDTEGMESRDSAVYRVDTIPDKAPTVRITFPERKEELITSHATMLVAFEAVDDFELVKMRLRYKVDTLDQGAEKTIELDLEEHNPQRIKRRYEWKIGALSPPLSEASKIEYWVEGEDNNDVTGPGIGASEHQFARVVSESEKRADLLNRAGDYLGSIGEVASDQQKLNEKLGTIIREKLLN
jgi:hypothetical protein